MKADFTRNTFDPWKHFTRVLMQQGRVQLDSDWNEQSAILLKYLQALAADLIGAHGGPSADMGFQIADGNIGTDFAISPGHYYVDGILCELGSPSAPVTIQKAGSGSKSNQFQIPSSSVTAFNKNKNKNYGQLVLLAADGLSLLLLTTIQSVTSDGLVTVTTSDGSTVSNILGAGNPRAYSDFTTYLHQPDYPLPTGSTLAAGSYLIYLDAWERLITYVEDDSIREVALNGADTAARTKLVCQVKQMAPFQPDKPKDPITAEDLRERLQPANRGRLMAQAKQNSTSTDPCVIAPDASYRGPENQLYRVEIHTGYGDGLTPTFKWSRENGSVVYPIVNFATSTAGGANTSTVVLENLGRDDRFGLAENDWVEVQDDDSALLNIVGNLLQVQSIDSANLTVTLSGVPSQSLDQTKHPLLRRWDQTFGDPAQTGMQMGPDNAALTADGTWLSLEDGIQVQFQPADADSPSLYRTGDYWLIPARTATGDIDWPAGTSGPLALPPQGVEHHYAPLAIITAGTGIQVSSLFLQQFKPLGGA
jgi:hypothetical protein